MLADQEPTASEVVGDVLVDSWGVAIGAIDAWLDSLSESAMTQFTSIRIGDYADGCESTQWEADGSRVQIIQAFTGLGSGAYDVLQLLDAEGRTVGLETPSIEEGDSRPPFA